MLGGKAGDDTTIDIVRGSHVAGIATTVQTYHHHVHIVETIHTTIHPEVAHLVETCEHTRQKSLSYPALALVVGGTPTATSSLGTPKPGLVGAPLANIEYERSATFCLTACIDIAYHLAHHLVAGIGGILVVAEVVLEHVHSPTVPHLHVRTLITVGTGLNACAGHGAGIGVYAHYHALVQGLYILHETCYAGGELLWVVGEF